MMDLRARFGLSFGVAVLLLANSAGAQDNLDRDKTPAQLFASDCALCHKSPQGLAKGGGLFGIQSFLRQHYTASKESAAAIAAYLEAVDRTAGPAQQRGAPKRAAKPASKKTDAKAGEPKSDAPKVSDGKPSDSKASETKLSEPKPADPKPGEAKPQGGKSD